MVTKKKSDFTALKPIQVIPQRCDKSMFLRDVLANGKTNAGVEFSVTCVIGSGDWLVEYRGAQVLIRLRDVVGPVLDAIDSDPPKGK